MQLVLEGGLWHPRDCGLCYLSRFLTGWGVYPWLVGLKLLGETGLYESCLRGLEARGLGRKIWIRWVERVVRRFNEMETKERNSVDEMRRKMGQISVVDTISEINN